MSNKQEVVRRLQDVGINYDDAVALRRIAMTLHSWHELECGADRGCIERDEATQVPYLTYDQPFSNGTRGRVKIPDKETGAIKRLQAIMKRYPGLAYYIQGDPRGAPLYILRPDDVPVGESMDAYYSRGIAVYK
jgi:hypothetical protein